MARLRDAATSFNSLMRDLYLQDVGAQQPPTGAMAGCHSEGRKEGSACSPFHLLRAERGTLSAGTHARPLTLALTSSCWALTRGSLVTHPVKASPHPLHSIPICRRMSMSTVATKQCDTRHCPLAVHSLERVAQSTDRTADRGRDGCICWARPRGRGGMACGTSIDEDDDDDNSNNTDTDNVSFPMIAPCYSGPRSVGEFCRAQQCHGPW